MHIIRDTREKEGWDFFPVGKIEQKKLDCGDYTTPALFDKCRIERKASTKEVYINLGRTVNKKRFYRELEKLQKFPDSIVITEFPESLVYEFPKGSTIPEMRPPSFMELKNGIYQKGDRINAWEELRINGRRLRSLIHEVNKIIPVVFCENRVAAQKYILQYFKELETKYNVS